MGRGKRAQGTGQLNYEMLSQLSLVNFGHVMEAYVLLAAACQSDGSLPHFPSALQV